CGTTSRAGAPCWGASGLPSCSYATNLCPLTASDSRTFVVYPPSHRATSATARESSATCSKSVSMDTPRQLVSSFVHLLTHEMSFTKSCAGRRWNSSHVQETDRSEERRVGKE